MLEMPIHVFGAEWRMPGAGPKILYPLIQIMMGGDEFESKENLGCKPTYVRPARHECQVCI